MLCLSYGFLVLMSGHYSRTYECKLGGTTPACNPPGAWAQGIALRRHLGAVRCEASLAMCTADHLLMEFLLGARRGKASLATGLSGPPTGGITGTCAACSNILDESCLDTAHPRFLLKGNSD